MNRELPTQSHLSSSSEATDQTSVSYPYTRYCTFSATKVTGLGSRVIKFQPIRTDELVKFLEAEDSSPVVEAKTKGDDKYKARKIIIDHTSDSSEDEANRNILDTTLIEDDETETDKRELLMPGVAWLNETSAKRAVVETRDMAVTPMSSIFNKMSLHEHQPGAGAAQPERRVHNVNAVSNSGFKNPVVRNLRLLPASVDNSDASGPLKNSALMESNMQTPAGQRIQYSMCSRSTIKDNAKSLGPTASNRPVSRKKHHDYIRPRADQNNFHLAPKFETPRQNIQASITRNNYLTPRQTLLPTVRPKQKYTDIVLREKNLNIQTAEHQLAKDLHAGDSDKQNSVGEQQQMRVQMKQEIQEDSIIDSCESKQQQQQKQNGCGAVQFSIPGALVSPDHRTFQSLNVRGKGYIVINKLGEGGSCQVYNCLEQDTLQPRAIKVVNLAVDTVTATGYINEVKLLRDLQGNDRVIKMFEYEQVKQTLFVVMEQGDVDFSVFLRTIATETQVPTHITICYWIEMLKCVKEIHNNGIIHSDLKPSNFLIVGGRLKLIDFGIASRLSAEMTSVIKNVQVGTFNYISPEALLDSRDANSPTDGKPRIRISYKSDVWSLGCILYQMIYRRTPFHSYGNPWTKIAMIVDRNHCIEYPQTEGVPPKLIEVIKSCLVHDMKRRPTVEELLTMYTTNLYC